MTHGVPPAPPDPHYTVVDPIIYRFFEAYLKTGTTKDL
jgi:hypothetical protein